eukprot:SAG31_NODE_451_length_15511_cov_77.547301_3_plen_189_part_00
MGSSEHAIQHLVSHEILVTLSASRRGEFPWMSKIQVQQVSTPGPLPPGGIVAVAAEDVRPSSEAWASQTTPTAAATPDQSVSMVEIVTPPQSSVGSSSVDYDLKQMAQPQSKQLSRVGLAVDSASRRLSLTRDCLPPGIYRWQVQENEQAWTWFTDIDEDRSAAVRGHGVIALVFSDFALSVQVWFLG